MPVYNEENVDCRVISPAGWFN